MNKERKINIRKMSWFVIKRWRLIIIGAICCSVIFTALQYRKDYLNAVNSQAAVEEVPLSDIKNSFSENQLREIEYVRISELMIDSADDYFMNSILMKIPYDEIVQVSLQYEVVAENDDINSKIEASLVAAYNNYVTSGALSESVANKMADGISAQYLTEIFSVPSSTSGHPVAYDNELVSGKIFTMTMVHYDREKAIAISEKIKESLQEYSNTLKSQMGNHQLVFQTENIGMTTDYDILVLQSARLEGYDSISGNYLTRFANLSADQVKVYSNWDSLEDVETEEENRTILNNEEKSDIKVNINGRSIIVGFVGGIFLVTILLMILFIGTKRVRGIEDFEVLDIFCLGTMKSERKKKKWLAVIDDAIIKLQYFNKRKYTDEQIVKLLYSNILLKCKNAQVKMVYLTGTIIDEERTSIWSQSLQHLLEEKGIRLIIGEDITCNADAMLDASEMKNVIIVEKENISLFGIVEEEIEICKSNGINVMGAIFVQA